MGQRKILPPPSQAFIDAVKNRPAAALLERFCVYAGVYALVGWLGTSIFEMLGIQQPLQPELLGTVLFASAMTLLEYFRARPHLQNQRFSENSE